MTSTHVHQGPQENEEQENKRLTDLVKFEPKKVSRRQEFNICDSRNFDLIQSGDHKNNSNKRIHGRQG